MTKGLLVIPVIGAGFMIVTLATLGFCGDGCGLIGKLLMLQHYILHSQALALSYSAVGLVGFSSYLLPHVYEKSSREIESEDAFALLFQILKEDERKVLTAIANSAGHTTQREIARRTNLSRLKTHRVVMRLKERGLVNAERKGRVSEVSLSPWLCGKQKDN